MFTRPSAISPNLAIPTNRKLRQFHDSLNPSVEDEDDNDDDEAEFPPPPEPGQLLDFGQDPDDPVNISEPVKMTGCGDFKMSMNKSKSTDHLEAAFFVTMPRASSTRATPSGDLGDASSAGGAVVAMRRSASVPCKRVVSRGSTGSSDSGFSAGSPTNQQTKKPDE